MYVYLLTSKLYCIAMMLTFNFLYFLLSSQCRRRVASHAHEVNAVSVALIVAEVVT